MLDVNKTIRFFNLKKVPQMMDWDDIKVGERYHLPPLVYNGRFDFVVKEKDDRRMRILKDGETYPQIMFKSDINARFITKKIELNG